jgi:uncharacterized protein YukE
MPGVSASDIANLYAAADDWERAASTVSSAVSQASDARKSALSGWTGLAAEAFGELQARFESPAESVAGHFREIAAILRQVASEAEAYNSTLAAQQGQSIGKGVSGLGGLLASLLAGL